MLKLLSVIIEFIPRMLPGPWINIPKESDLAIRREIRVRGMVGIPFTQRRKEEAYKRVSNFTF